MKDFNSKQRASSQILMWLVVWLCNPKQMEDFQYKWEGGMQRMFRSCAHLLSSIGVFKISEPEYSWESNYISQIRFSEIESFVNSTSFSTSTFESILSSFIDFGNFFGFLVGYEDEGFFVEEESLVIFQPLSELGLCILEDEMWFWTKKIRPLMHKLNYWGDITLQQLIDEDGLHPKFWANPNPRNWEYYPSQPVQ